MRQFSVFVTPFYSFFSRALFRDVGTHWRGSAFAYLLFLLAVCWIPFSVGVYFQWSAFVVDEAPAITEQIPAITIENGRVFADVDQPYFIRTTEPDEVFAIIDTTGQIDSLDERSARFLLTASEVMIKKNEAETRVYDLSSVQEFYMDGPKAQRWLGLAGRWALVLLYPAAVVGSYGYRLMQVLFYAVLGLLLAKLVGCRLNYAGIVRVALVAITPAIVLKTVLWIADISFPYAWLLYFAVAMGYLAFGLSSNCGGPDSELSASR